MRKKKALFLLGILAGFGLCCGKKGPIVPPVLKLPQKAANFQAVQQGAHILLSWQNPEAYTDGSLLEAIAKIEIWVAESVLHAENAAVPLTAGEFPAHASLMKSLEPEEFEPKIGAETLSYSIDIQSSDFGAKRFTFGLRVFTGRRRKSAFSDLAAVEPIIIPQAPRNLRARVLVDRIELEWDAPDKNIDESMPAAVKGYFVTRTDSEGIPVRLNNEPLEALKTEDRDFIFGRSYIYTVRASAAEAPPYAESDPSPDLRIEARDTFPPKAPHGFIAIVGRGFVALSWEVNRESDLMGYRVWRKRGGEEEFIPLESEPIPDNVFTDRTVKASSDYAYVVTAIDQQGNESRISDVVHVHIEGDRK